MQFFTIAAAAASFAVAMALPSPSQGQQTPLCSGNNSPHCCEASLLGGVASMGCKATPGDPNSKTAFIKACRSVAMNPMCCTTSVSDLGVVCESPVF